MGRIKGYILAAVSAISYGMIPYFVIPVKRSELSLNTALFYRFSIAALCLAAIMIFKKISFKAKSRDIVVFLLLGLFYGGGSDLLFVGYDYLTPGIASTAFFIYPVFVAIIMSVFFKEKIKRLTVISLIVVLVGVYVLSAAGEGFSIHFFGLFVALSSALLYALYIITVNKGELKGSGWWITFYVLVATAAYYFVKVLVRKDSVSIPDTSTLYHFIAFALVTTVISVTCLTYAINLIGSTPTSILGALEPIVAVGISVYLFGENMNERLIIGVILIIAGVILNIVADSKKVFVEEPE